MNDTPRIGFMQGRLSPLINDRIQAFPWNNWKYELLLAQQINIHLMEWTLDQERLYENPLLTNAGQADIRALCQRYAVGIPSLTGDCFMQAPLWKAQGAARTALERDFSEIARGCAAVGITMMIIPLVDNGRLESLTQEDDLINFLENKEDFLAANGLKVLFESDYAPQQLARFIARLNPALFGINYDIGNSAALGFDPQDEFMAYGMRIVNVHIKDRVLGGATTPLGMGNANFDAVFSGLTQINYQGNLILQTARATNGDHVGTLCAYRDMTVSWLRRHHAA